MLIWKFSLNALKSYRCLSKFYWLLCLTSFHYPLIQWTEILQPISTYVTSFRLFLESSAIVLMYFLPLLPLSCPPPANKCSLCNSVSRQMQEGSPSLNRTPHSNHPCSSFKINWITLCQLGACPWTKLTWDVKVSLRRNYESDKIC
jgi:hypothetical protein